MLRSILITLAVAAGDGAPPTEVCLLKPGANQTRKGVYIFDDAAAASVMDAYRAHGQTDLPIDWEHASLSASRAPDPKKAGEACGWFTLELREGALWAANIRWTKDGAEALSERKYRFCSPAFFTDKDGRVTRMVNMALTNLPATDDQAPLMAASQSDTITDQPGSAPAAATLTAPEGAPAPGTAGKERRPMKDMIVLLGLVAGSTEADAEAKITSLREFEVQVLSLTGKSTVAEVIGHIQGLQAAADKLPKVEAELATLSAKAVEAERDALIAANEKKISPAMLPWAKTQTVEALKAFLAVAPELVALGAQPPREPNADAVALSESELDICRRLHITPDQYAAVCAAEKEGAR